MAVCWRCWFCSQEALSDSFAKWTCLNVWMCERNLPWELRKFSYRSTYVTVFKQFNHQIAKFSIEMTIGQRDWFEFDPTNSAGALPPGHGTDSSRGSRSFSLLYKRGSRIQPHPKYFIYCQWKLLLVCISARPDHTATSPGAVLSR